MSQSSHDNTLSHSFIGKQADDLGQLISEQIKPLYESLGIQVPVKSCSIVHALQQRQHASVTELARALNQSHQLVKQKLPRLLKLGLIQQQADASDKRKTLYQLTAEGQAQAQLLAAHSMAAVYAELSAEVGGDLFQLLQAAITRLQQKDLYSRYQEQQSKQP